jgi:hypothetical protein
MIAMHYRFPLPADYDMAIIDRRIAEKGHFTDGFPGLCFKAYLSARAGQALENAYAPFYVWHTVEGMNAFLNGPGFAALTRSFGRPAVALWAVWQAELAPGFEHARFAAIERQPIAPGTDLAALRAAETAAAVDAVRSGGALGAVAGFEPGTWTLLRFTLWAAQPDAGPEDARLVYAVGHVSRGGQAA